MEKGLIVKLIFSRKCQLSPKPRGFVELCCFQQISFVVLDPLLSHMFIHRSTSKGSSFVVKALTYKFFSFQHRSQRSYTVCLFCVCLSQ